MLNKIIRASILLLLTIVVTASIVPASAFASSEETSSDDTIVINVMGYINDMDAFDKAVSEALNDNKHVKIINIDQLSDVLDTNANYEPLLPKNNISPMSAAGQVIYEIRNKQTLSNEFGADYFTMSGTPGNTIGLSLSQAKTKSYAISFTSSFGAAFSVLANAMWGTSKSVTLTYTGTYKVPAKVNGKKVERAYIHMRPEFKRKKGDVYSKTVGYTDWKKKGSTTSKKAYSVHIYNTFVYK